MIERDQQYLQRKAVELNLARGGYLERIQVELERMFPGQVRAVSLNKGVLKLATPSAALASELRLNQDDWLRRFKGLVGEGAVTGLGVQIRAIS